MKRILRPKGTVVLIETMGSLHIWEEVPEKNVELYDYFEKDLRLKKTTIRTDYKFATKEEAVDYSTFFFGDEVGAEVSEIGELMFQRQPFCGMADCSPCMMMRPRSVGFLLGRDGT
jgi:hypothetical protein